MSKLLLIDIQNARPLTATSAEVGIEGERLAAEFLESNGYRLVLSNFKVPIGRNSRGVSVTGEIDIVAVDGDTLCFVEVKTKTSSAFAEPLASVTRRKQRQIIRTARVYRRIFNLSEMPRRYDVVSIVLERDARPAIELIKGFWSESKFRKKAWSGDIH
ncbi:MAG: YraN family protein [Pyrinomonadaceae bacterium]